MSALDFDLEIAIRDFLADSTRSSFELPRLTTGQRKHVKTCVKEYPELICESFGFGQERRLQLFKQSANQIFNGSGSEVCNFPDQTTTDQTTALVAQKETYIDDWHCVESCTSHLQSAETMQASLQASVLPAVDHDEYWLECDKKDQVWDAMSGDQSTIASSESSLFGDSPVPNSQEVEVRNTFIHFQTAVERDDERAVQSMPHGMFSKCIRAETTSLQVSNDHGCKSAPTSTVTRTFELAPQSNLVFGLPTPAEVDVPKWGCPSVVDRAPPKAAEPMKPLNNVSRIVEPAIGSCTQSYTLDAGTEVVICGLVKCPAFNGLRGTVQSLDMQSGRYDILLEPNSSGHKWAKVKRDNVQLLVRVPPAGTASGLVH